MNIYRIIYIGHYSIKLFCCFSCGIESRVGIGFDRHRTKSQYFNKMVKR